MTLRSQGRGCWRASATLSRESFAHAGYRARTASTSWGGGAACWRLGGFAAPDADGTNVDGVGEVRMGAPGAKVGGSGVPGRRETRFVRSVERTRRLTSPAGGASGHRAGLVRDDSSVRPNHRESAPTSKFAEGGLPSRRLARASDTPAAFELVRSCARAMLERRARLVCAGADPERPSRRHRVAPKRASSRSTPVVRIVIDGSHCAHRARARREMRCLSWQQTAGTPPS